MATNDKKLNLAELAYTELDDDLKEIMKAELLDPKPSGADRILVALLIQQTRYAKKTAYYSSL